MEQYHHIDKQTFSNVHFKMTLPIITVYDNRIEIESKYMPQVGSDAIHSILLQCCIVDTFNQKHSSGKNYIVLNTGKVKNISIDILFEKKILLSKSEIQFTFISSNEQKNIVSYYIDSSGKVTLREVQRISMTEVEKELFIEILQKDSVKNTASEKKKHGDEAIASSILPHNLMEYVNALHKEVYYLRNKGGRQYKVVNGEKLKAAKEGYYYIFELEDELYLADDAPISVSTNAERQATGNVLLCEDFQILIVVDKDMGDRIHSAYIRVEPWKLLVAQAERIMQINPSSHRIAIKLMNEGPTLVTKQSIECIDKGQQMAKEHVLRDDITVVWGPPGTGKTHTMAKIAIDNIEQGKSVLIVSHSNVSVDGVIKKVIKMLRANKDVKKITDGAILRYGYVRDSELSMDEYATSFNYALIHCKELHRKLDALLEEKEKYKSGGYVNKSHIVDIEKEIKTIRNKIHTEEKKYVAKAKLVGTTISKVIVDSVFSERQYDVVMFDEVSMAYVTQIICAATMARSKFICVGDFKQLPPISQDSVAKNTLNVDIFGYLGIIDKLGNMYNHLWLVMLDEQRRMHPDIADFVNNHIYRHLLKNHPDTYTSRISILEREPMKNCAMSMIDLSGTYCAASKNSNNSRYNVLSAILSFATAMTAEKNLPHDEKEKKTVGIITPYAAQAKLIRAMTKDEKTKQKTDIVCATVHQFQGSESDVIVFDAVESYPTSKAGFLMSKEMSTVQRLINVAVTRAKGKFINIANGKFWMKEFEKQKQHTYYQLVCALLENHNVISVKGKNLQDYIRSLNTGKNIIFYLQQNECIEQLTKDLMNAKQRIIISIPDGKLDEGATKVLAEVKRVATLGIEVLIKSKDYDNLPEEWQMYCIKSNNAEFPIINIDNKIMWYGLPVGKGGFKVNEWQFLTVCPIIARIKGENTIDMISSLCELEMVQDGDKKMPIEIKKQMGKKLGNETSKGLATFISKKQFCPECKNHLIMARGKTGKFYLKCSKTGCKHTEFLKVDMINHYINIQNITCPQDHGEVQGRLGEYGVYIHCSCGHNLKPDQI